MTQDRHDYGYREGEPVSHVRSTQNSASPFPREKCQNERCEQLDCRHPMDQRRNRGAELTLRQKLRLKLL